MNLKAQLEEAHRVIDALSNCIDPYYIEVGHRSIDELEKYDAKYRPEEPGMAYSCPQEAE